MKLPRKLKGTDTPNHIAVNASIVKKGTAPAELPPIKKKFNKRKEPKTSLT